MSIETIRTALLDAYAAGYISFDDAAPIADFIAELDAAQPDYISF